MACFPSSGAALAQLAAIVNPANKPTKVKWWPLLVQGLGKLWESCSLIRVLIKGLVLLGKACSLNLAILEMACFPSSGAALAQLAAIVNPANKPTKVKWGLYWSRALENCGKAVL